jgi:uncharacterized Zn finger protein (UPF0148 family)
MAPRKGTRRACDACSVRKVKCDGGQPCSCCQAASWDCTYLKTHGKSGPKGPRRTTEAAIKKLQQRRRDNLESSAKSESDTSLEDGSPSTINFQIPKSITATSERTLEMYDWPEAISPRSNRAHSERQRISTSHLSHFFDLYQERGYSIWPVVDTGTLTTCLLTCPDDMEAYGLATAICAATISQFQINAEPDNPVGCKSHDSSALFEKEAKRSREESDHMENVTIASLLSTFFLHVYSANVGRMAASTVLLTEAISKAHIIGLHKSSYYQRFDAEQQQHSLRIYWLLFITER